MNLLSRIKEASILARKCRSTNATFLVTLYSEAAMVGKTLRNGESTDEEVIKILKKFKVGAESMIAAALTVNTIKKQSIIDKANAELQIIEQFLPKMLSEEELKIIITQYFYDLGGGKVEHDPRLQIGNFMTQLKKEYVGLYDGLTALKLIKELLN